MTRPSTVSAEPIGFLVDAGAGYTGVLRQQLGDEQRLVAQPPFDERALLGPQIPGDDRRRDGQRRRGNAERRGKDLGAEPDVHDASSSRSL